MSTVTIQPKRQITMPEILIGLSISRTKFLQLVKAGKFPAPKGTREGTPICGLSLTFKTISKNWSPPRDH